MRHRFSVVGLVARSLLAPAGCGGAEEPSDQARATRSPARTAEPAPAPPAAPAGRSLRFEATDGVPLRGTLIPGKRSWAPVVVLVHQADGGPNEFEDFVPHLHVAGYGALTYESREDDRLDEVKNSRDGRPRNVLLIADGSERAAADLIADGDPGIEVRTAPLSGHGVALLPDERVRMQVLDFLAQRLQA